MIFLLTLIAINQSVYSRGDEVGNGAGLFENKVLEVFNKIDIYIDQALINTQFNYIEKRILTDILNTQKIWKENTEFKFFPESNQFFIDNEYRIALTGTQLTSPIIININKLYSIPIDELHLTLISLLIHELGHKIGETNHNLLDGVGAHVASNVFDSSFIFYTDVMKKDEFIEVFKFVDEKKSDYISYTTKNYVYNLSKMIEKKNICEGTQKGFNFHFNKETSTFEGLILIECDSTHENKLMTIQIQKVNALFGEFITVDLLD